MFLLLRIVFGLLLLFALGCISYALIKREPRWQRLGMMVLKWTLIALVGSIAVILAQHFWPE